MKNIIKSEFFKIRKSNVTGIMFAVTAGMALLMSFMLLMIGGMRSPMETLGVERITGSEMLFLAFEGDILFILVGIFAALLFGQDYTSGSIRQIIGKGIGREKYVFSILPCLTLWGVGMMVLFELLVFAAGAVGGDGIGRESAVHLVWLVVGIFVAVLFYTSYIVLLMTWFQKISVALIFAIMTPSVESILLVGASLLFGEPEIQNMGMVLRLETVIGREFDMAGRLPALISFLVPTLVFSTVSVLVFRKKDIN